MSATSLSWLFLLGLALSAAPGALNVETVRRALRHGFGAALTLQLGALLGDGLWVALTATAVALGGQTGPLMPACMVLGGVALIWTAWQILRPRVAGEPPAAAPSRRRGLALGAALALSSPLTVVFWAAVTAMLGRDLGRAVEPAELGLVAVIYVLSVLLWAVTLSCLATWGRHLLRPFSGRAADLCCAALLAMWGVRLIGQAAGVLA